MRLVPLAFLLLLASPPVYAATPDPATALLEQSRDAQNKGEAELAVRMAQAAIVADPARPASYVALGDLYATAGQGEFARSFYDAALEIDPADAGAQHAIAALGNNKATAAASP
jgi:tetratricopeptide (TPR) repeat protein